MKRIHWVIVFLFFSVTSVYSQQVLSDRHIQWQDPRSYHLRIDPDHALTGRYYSFDEARYFDSQTLLPWYYELIPVEGTSAYRVDLTNTHFKPLSGDVSLNDSARQQISERVEVRAERVYGGDQA